MYDPDNDCKWQEQICNVIPNDPECKDDCWVLKPKNSSITEAGGLEMSKYDKIKLMEAYGCNACGGHKYSLSGGAFSARSSPPIPESYCDWVLRTSNDKKINIEFSVTILYILINEFQKRNNASFFL